MINDTVLKMEGLKALTEKLGILEAEHFITLIKREPFNYTEWRAGLFEDVPLDVFLQKAADFRTTRQPRHCERNEAILPRA